MASKKFFDISPPASNAQDRGPQNSEAVKGAGASESNLQKWEMPRGYFTNYGLFFFFFAAISYLEFVFGLWTFRRIGTNYIFSALFAIPAASIFFLISLPFSKKINRLVSVLITALLTLAYFAQLIYYYIFHTPLSLYSLIGTKDAAQFWDVAATAIVKNGIAVILLFIPLIFLLFLLFSPSRQPIFSRQKPRTFAGIVLIGILGYALSVLCLRATTDKDFSQYALYYDIASPELSMRKLGVLTTMRLDLQRLIFGFEENAGSGFSAALPALTSTTASPAPQEYNMTAVDFEKLAANETDANILDMHAYFSSRSPTNKNEYTGMFKGKNLIFFVAESFSPYAMSPELTPTLYKMSEEGFSFTNFYNPVWGVSTSDGEYVSLTGLLPKSGVWSMRRSGANYLPFVLGNQFKKLGYATKAYHNHTYTYYGRNESMPNLGYDYKGVGNGLKVNVTWPESDLEMIDVTASEYISTSTPFHTYYVTVSGHREYNFYGNYIAIKNKPRVTDLPYSETARAYIAANFELELAMESLIEKLEAAGTLDNTVIAIVPDHYPYGLPKETLDELAGHEVESNFELYKSVFILWKKGMNPIVVDQPVSTLDILPTISNLFGLEYDSRLMMGRDVFSDMPPLVIFLNRSWITDKEMYNSTKANAVNILEGDIEYEKTINQIVADKFKYSTKILETDYYAKVVPK